MAEKSLIAAVMEQAIQDYRWKDSKGRPSIHKRPAECWMKCNNSEPFSFVWCCDVLEIDPDKARNAILKNLN